MSYKNDFFTSSKRGQLSFLSIPPGRWFLISHFDTGGAWNSLFQILFMPAFTRIYERFHCTRCCMRVAKNANFRSRASGRPMPAPHFSASRDFWRVLKTDYSALSLTMRHFNLHMRWYAHYENDVRYMMRILYVLVANSRGRGMLHTSRHDNRFRHLRLDAAAIAAHELLLLV